MCDLQLIEDEIQRAADRRIAELPRQVMHRCFDSIHFSVCGLHDLSELPGVKQHWHHDQPEYHLLEKLHCQNFKTMAPGTRKELECVVQELIDRAFAESKATMEPKPVARAVPIVQRKWWEFFK